jgi:hypothetical protein
MLKSAWWTIPGIGQGHFNTVRRFMPKIRVALPETVFYLYRVGLDGRKSGPFGTGFLVIRSSMRGASHIYGVSNSHVVCGKCGASIIRVNTRDGKSRFIELDPSEWEMSKNGDDLVAVDLSEKINPNTDQVIGLFEDSFVTPEWIDKFEIGIGEDTFMCGLFVSHHGGEKNIPVARFGNLSMMANEDAMIEMETGAKRPCHLVDTRSRSGFSGSPVFVYRNAQGDLSWLPYGTYRPADLLTTRASDYFWGLLGIHCGQFWDTINVKIKKKPKTENASIKEGDELEIQGGMTIVIPAERIIKLLNLEIFEMARQKRENDRDDDCRPHPEAIEGAPQATNANPTHLEDFSRLVDVAARKRPRDDQP